MTKGTNATWNQGKTKQGRVTGAEVETNGEYRVVSAVRIRVGAGSRQSAARPVLTRTAMSSWRKLTEFPEGFHELQGISDVG